MTETPDPAPSPPPPERASVPAAGAPVAAPLTAGTPPDHGSATAETPEPPPSGRDPGPAKDSPSAPSPGAAEPGPAPHAALPGWAAALLALNFLLALGGIAWVWQTSQPAGTEGLASLRQQVVELDQRLAAQETAPPGSAAPASAAERAELTKLAGQVAALEAHPAGAAGLDQLRAEVTALRAALAAAAPADASALAAVHTEIGATRKDLAALAARVAAATAGQRDLGQRIDTLHHTAGTATTLLMQRLSADEARLDALTAQVAGLRADAGQTELLARLQAAQAALDAGRPLGTLPDAPPALARYAGTSPPTEVSLRLAFPAASHAALAASRPDTAALPLLGRLWARAQSLVMLRQGDKVILGDPAAGILAAAQARLDAGDLAGAVTALARLDGPAAKAMAPWRSQAEDLLAARAALARMRLPPGAAPAVPAPSGTTVPPASPPPVSPLAPTGPAPAAPAAPPPAAPATPAPRQAAALPGVVRG